MLTKNAPTGTDVDAARVTNLGNEMNELKARIEHLMKIYEDFDSRLEPVKLTETEPRQEDASVEEARPMSPLAAALGIQNNNLSALISCFERLLRRVDL